MTTDRAAYTLAAAAVLVWWLVAAMGMGSA